MVDLPGVGDAGTPTSTLTWTSNQTSVVTFDLVDLVNDPAVGPTSVYLDFGAAYWIRVKLYVPYVGTGTARCACVGSSNQSPNLVQPKP